MDHAIPDQTVTPVVAIGASAGGLEAMKELVRELSPNTPYAFIIAQHLSPSHVSLLVELISRETKLNVVNAMDGELLKPGTIYITPPNCDVEYVNGRIELGPPASVGPKPSINLLLQSLASSLRDNAVAVILSGTGSDGAAGCVSVRSAGGVVLVQDPSTAKYDGMPNAAIGLDAADKVLSTGEIGRWLSGALDRESYEEGEPGELEDSVKSVLAMLLQKSGLDISQYKTSTVHRRINRRMNLRGIASYADYTEYLSNNDEEAKNLARDLLISVTEFFRDKNEFEALRKHIEDALKRVSDESTYRVWIPGCATGEEPYSIALLIEEAARKLDRNIKYQIFATDIDKLATAKGRLGSYTAKQVANVPDPILKRYFLQNDNATFTLKKSVREQVLFAEHNLISDPPFSRIDLISCRNLLIYFTAPLQRQVFETFHYALKNTGLLFLGKSENVYQAGKCLITIDPDAHIFGRNNDSMAIIRPAKIEHKHRELPEKSPAQPKNRGINHLRESIQRTLVSAYAPPSVVINEVGLIRFVDEAAREYLSIKAGVFDGVIFDLVHPGLRACLRAMVHKAKRKNASCSCDISIETESGETLKLQLSVHSVLDLAGHFLISFLKIDASAIASDVQFDTSQVASDVILELEHELASTKENLQTVVEELETSNEELQSLNEELQSSNEELQSTNEEMQTSNEELQSSNEELLTVNEELHIKSNELEFALSDLETIQESIGHPLFAVDENLHLRRFNSALFKLLISKHFDTHEKVTALVWRFDISDIAKCLLQTASDGKPRSVEVTCDDASYAVDIHPQLSPRGNQEGAVAIFVDVTDLTQTKLSIERTRARLAGLLDTMQDGILVASKDLYLKYKNHLITEMMGIEAEPQRLSDIFNRQQITIIKKLLKNLDKDSELAAETARIVMSINEEQRFFELTVSPLTTITEGDEFTLRLRDITLEVVSVKQLKQQREIAFSTLNNIDEAIITLDQHGKVLYLNPVARLMLSIDDENPAATHIESLLIPFPANGMPHPITAAAVKTEQTLLQDQTFVNRHQDTLVLDIGIYPLRGEDNEGAVVMLHQASARLDAEDKLNFHANHDTLTGLLNRRSFEARVRHELLLRQTSKLPLTLLFLDLDQFKVVNDTCGHNAGDQLLKNISTILRHKIRRHDLIARMGGDEFAILLVDCEGAIAQTIAHKIVEAFKEFRFDWNNKRFSIGVSIGLVEIDSAEHSLDSILSRADTACYLAKESGRSKVITHALTDVDVQNRQEQMEWVSQIQKAIDETLFELYVQPIECLRKSKTQEIRGEVLIRMKGDDDTLIAPGSFLPAADRFGLSPSIDEWVINQVIYDDNIRRIAESHEHFGLSINLSPSSLSSETFVNALEAKLIESRFPAHCLTFEVLETGAISNLQDFLDFVKRMKRLGVHFALDDFGTGMSSFSYLKMIDLDFLKIDGAFITDLLSDPVDSAMVEAINRVAHIMGLQTIAEYVENSETKGALMAMGIDYIQGYHVARPCPINDWLESIQIRPN